MLGPGLGLPQLPLGGGQAVWRCEEKPSPGSGGKCRREGGRSQLQEVGGGEDVGEARRSDSQDLSRWERQPRTWCSPAWAQGWGAGPGIPRPRHPDLGREPALRDRPPAGAGRGGNLGLWAGLKGQWGTVCPGQPPSLHSPGTSGGEGGQLGASTLLAEDPEWMPPGSLLVSAVLVRM